MGDDLSGVGGVGFFDFSIAIVFPYSSHLVPSMFPRFLNMFPITSHLISFAFTLL